jgi:hypothetical protein
MTVEAFDGGVPRSWLRDRTVVRVYDGGGREIAVFDGATGISWILPELGGEWELDTSIFPPGRWVFDGVYLTNDSADAPRGMRAMREEGTTENSPEAYQQWHDSMMALEDPPWDYPGATSIFVTFAERDTRLSICHDCEFYDHFAGVCRVDGNFMPNKTVNAAEECPDGKWGQGVGYSPEAEAARASLLPPVPIEDQQDFEAEWEARNAAR